MELPRTFDVSDEIIQEKENAKRGQIIFSEEDHKIEDITESVYTDRDIEWSRKDIEKLK